jgi:SagB-type dehydrogenase family enzyme
MIASLPLSTNGKVDYGSLPDPLETIRDSTVSPETHRPLRTKVLSVIGELLKLPSVSPDANLLDLGADSITVIRLANRLQAELSIKSSVAAIYRMERIEQLLEYCEKNSVSESPLVNTVSAEQAAITSMITDPAERQKFKETHSALRVFPSEQLSVSLGMPDADSRVLSRRSQRQFSLRPIELADFGKWLGALCLKDVGGQQKYLYASAGGLYPVQTYVYVKAGRIANLVEGLYYHDPVQHKLVLQTTDAVIHRDDFDPFVNRTTFDESAFCMFFVSAMAQIEPLYGEHSERFASIETGFMLQILDLQALDAEIGLCHIGDLVADKFLAELPQRDRPRLILSALGGIPNVQPKATDEDKFARSLARVAELSPEQVRSLLLAKQGQRK